MLPTVSPDAHPLPMAPSGCALDGGQLAEQIARYRQLSNSVLDIDRDELTARILLGENVETLLLEQTLAIEHGCCNFFTLDYDPSTRVLTITTDLEHCDGLSALLAALTLTSRPDDMSPTPIPSTNQCPEHRALNKGAVGVKGASGSEIGRPAF